MSFFEEHPIASICGGLGIIFTGFTGLASIKIIDPGYVGVYRFLGTIDPKPLNPGFHLINPIAVVQPMKTQIQRHEAEYNAASLDMQTVKTKMVLNYSLIGDQAPNVFQTIGIEYEKTIIDPAAQEVLKAMLAVHPASEILQKRQEIKNAVQEHLAVWLQKYGILLNEISIAEINFDQTYEDAIEAKQVQEQLAQQKTYELEQARMQAQIVAANAEGEAQAVRARAEGEAESLRIRGEAQADYNEKVAASLTPSLIQQQYLLRWDGKLPTIVGEGNLMLQVPSGQ